MGAGVSRIALVLGLVLSSPALADSYDQAAQICADAVGKKDDGQNPPVVEIMFKQCMQDLGFKVR